MVACSLHSEVGHKQNTVWYKQSCFNLRCSCSFCMWWSGRSPPLSDIWRRCLCERDSHTFRLHVVHWNIVQQVSLGFSKVFSLHLYADDETSVVFDDICLFVQIKDFFLVCFFTESYSSGSWLSPADRFSINRFVFCTYLQFAEGSATVHQVVRLVSKYRHLLVLSEKNRSLITVLRLDEGLKTFCPFGILF